MSNIVEFENANHKTRSARHSKNPIIIMRLDKNSVALGFHKFYFRRFALENTMQRLSTGGSWSLQTPNNNISPLYRTYVVALRQNYFGSLADDMLLLAVDRIIKEVYFEELDIWGSNIEKYDPTSSDVDYTQGGVIISDKIKKMLVTIGVETVEDLVNLSREELCELTNITTDNVVELEKNLAAYGLFLRTEIPKFF